MARVRHVGVVGAGLAGLTAALAAAAAGAQVDVFEAADRLAAPPAHIDVVPNLLRDLAALGVGEACVRRGFPYRGVAFVDAGGRTLFEVPTLPLAGPRLPAAIGIAYADLLRVVHDAAVERGVALHWQSRVSDVVCYGARSRLALADGREVAVDLAVLAGATNVGAAAPSSGVGAERLPQRWDHVAIRRPAALDRTTWVCGARATKALLVPTGVTSAGLALLRDERDGAAPRGSDAAALRDALAHGGPLLRDVAALLPRDAVVTARPVVAGVLRGAWHEGGVLRIGNAAHVLPPHFGQAAAQALEDATVLGELLREATDRDDLGARFTARRAARAADVLALVAQAARWDLDPEPATDLPVLARRLAQIVREPA